MFVFLICAGFNQRGHGAVATCLMSLGAKRTFAHDFLPICTVEWCWGVERVMFGAQNSVAGSGMMPNLERARARPIRIFQGEGKPLADDMMYPVAMVESVVAGFKPAIDAGLDNGHKLRCLLRSEGPDGSSLCRAWLKSGFVTPRHSHDSDCTYFVLAGTLIMGATIIGPGGGVFVPANSVYFLEAGPSGVEVLEFRPLSRFNVSYRGNSSSHWTRFKEAVVENVAKWRTQRPPSQPAA